MGRTVLSPARQKNMRNINIGRIILFCEGLTEKLYFEYFSEIIEKSKFDDINIQIESADGNASRVLKFAEEYMTNEDNNRKYSNYKKYLVFDCDAPPNIQKVINRMNLSLIQFELLVSNYLFETWLLMHFEDVTEKITKREAYKRLSKHLVSDYKKASAGIIREILQNGNIEYAMQNAERLAIKYKSEGINVCNEIVKMNPFTNVNVLVEQLLATIS